MNSISRIIAPLALLTTIIPPLLFLFKWVSEPMMKGVMLAAAIAWFVSAPFWLKGAEE